MKRCVWLTLNRAMGQRGYLTLWPPTELSALRALGVLSLAVQMLPDLRDHHGPFADGRGDALDRTSAYVAHREDARLGGGVGRSAARPSPVRTKPLSSSFTRSDSQVVLGAAPTMMNSAQVDWVRVAPSSTLRMVTASSLLSPCSPTTSARYSIVILGSPPHGCAEPS